MTMSYKSSLKQAKNMKNPFSVNHAFAKGVIQCQCKDWMELTLFDGVQTSTLNVLSHILRCRFV